MLGCHGTRGPVRHHPRLPGPASADAGGSKAGSLASTTRPGDGRPVSERSRGHHARRRLADDGQSESGAFAARIEAAVETARTLVPCPPPGYGSAVLDASTTVSPSRARLAVTRPPDGVYVAHCRRD